MLLAALGATIIGFVLLIVALVTANLWLAIACVAVSVVGVLLLIGDVLTYRRSDSGSGETVDAAAGDDQVTEDDQVTDDADIDDAATADDRGPVADIAPAVAPDSDQRDPAADVRPERTAEAPASTDADSDAAREAGTVGHEEFGHHDEPATSVEPEAPSSSDDWSHESRADTDDDPPPVRSLLAPGTYDPDMTDQIPQIDVEQSWGAEWTPREGPDKK